MIQDFQDLETKRFKRLGGNKYNIFAIPKHDNETDGSNIIEANKKGKREKTYLDGLYKHILAISSNNKKLLSKLKRLINLMIMTQNQLIWI